MGDVAGKVIVITGASAGIGEATAIEAARAGMRVVVAARRQARLDDLADRCRAAGGEALAVATDVTSEEDVQRLIDRTVEQFGRIDVLLANAGLGHFAPLLETDAETERRLWDVNYHGAIRCIRAAAAAMRNQAAADGKQGRRGRRGHVMVTSSIVGRNGLPYYGVYAATKGAQHAAVAGLQVELEPDGIAVTCIYPGGTATEFFDVVAAGAGAETLTKNTPRIFLQTSEQVARKIIRCVRRPKPELWPSRLTRFVSLVWTLFPRLYAPSFRGHGRKCRDELRQLHGSAP